MVVAGANHHLDARFVDAVFNVVAEQLDRGGNDDGTEFVQGIEQIPELIVPPDDQHDPVAFADAHGIEQIGGPGGNSYQRCLLYYKKTKK